MNFDEARKKLGLENDADLEIVESAIEEKLFNFKKDILPLLPVPSLVKKRQAQLDAWITIENKVDKSYSTNSSMGAIENATDIVSFLEVYERELSKVKLEIMNAGSFSSLKHSLELAVELQTLYMRAFKKFFADYSEALPEETKSREIIDTGKLLNALKNNNMTSEVTWEIEKELGRIHKLIQFKENQ